MNVSSCCGAKLTVPRPSGTVTTSSAYTCDQCRQPCEPVDDLVEAVADQLQAEWYRGDWREKARRILATLQSKGVVRLAEDLDGPYPHQLAETLGRAGFRCVAPLLEVK